MLSRVDVQPSSLILCSSFMGTACYNDPTMPTSARRDYWFLADSPLITLTKADGSEQILHLSLKKNTHSGHQANMLEPSLPTGHLNETAPALPPKRRGSNKRSKPQFYGGESRNAFLDSAPPPIRVDFGARRRQDCESQKASIDSTPPPIPTKTLNFGERRRQDCESQKASIDSTRLSGIDFCAQRRRDCFRIQETPNPSSCQTLPSPTRLSASSSLPTLDRSFWRNLSRILSTKSATVKRQVPPRS